jgi:toxin ParE1/3/4
MTGTPLETLPRRTASARSYATQVDAVADKPRTWPRYGNRARRYVFPRFPFILVYRLRGDEVEILTVAHGRRRPGYWWSRL